MTTLNRKIRFVLAGAAALVLTSCAYLTPPGNADSSSGGYGATGIGNITGGSEGNTSPSGGATPSGTSNGIGNLTGGAEARPAADPGITPSAKPGK